MPKNFRETPRGRIIFVKKVLRKEGVERSRAWTDDTMRARALLQKPRVQKPRVRKPTEAQSDLRKPKATKHFRDAAKSCRFRLPYSRLPSVYIYGYYEV